MAHRFRLLVLLAAVGCGPPTGPPPFDIREHHNIPPEHTLPTTADGEVLGVDRQSPGRELTEGLSVRLRADGDQPIVVQLAPGWYLEENGIAYRPSERLSVRGKRSGPVGNQVLIATEVRSGERWITLRDEQGRPLWRQSEPGN
jgi:hypothetical protein